MVLAILLYVVFRSTSEKQRTIRNESTIERNAMSYRNERRREPRRRRRNGCLALLVALIWIILLAVIGYRYWLRPQISQYVGRQIGEQVGAAGQAGNGTPQQQIEA